MSSLFPALVRSHLRRLTLSVLTGAMLTMTGLPLLAAKAAAMVKLESRDGKMVEGTVLAVTDSTVKLKRRDGKEFDIPLERLTEDSVRLAKESLPPPAPPVIPAKPATPDDIPEKVIVKTGEKVAFSFTVTKGKLHNPKPLAKEDGEKADLPCFTVEMSRRDGLTLAMVKQTILPAVKVRCLARNKGQTRYYPTSILDLQKGLPCGESWGDDVEELVFFGMEETEPLGN